MRLSKDKLRLNLTEQELLSVARVVGGEEGDQSLVIHVDPIGGFCSQDIHPLSDRYNVVYWGGDATEAHRLWAFQISRNRLIKQGRPAVFDSDRDYPVNLKEAGIAVFMPFEGGREELKEGLFMVKEGGVIHVDTTSIHGATTIPLTFPTRLHHQLPLGNVMLPL